MTPEDRSNDEQTTIKPVVAQSQEASNKKSGVDSITEEKIAKLIVNEDITVEPIDNVWVRISEQMLIPIPDNARIAKHRNWYLKHPQHLKTVSQRAEPFLYLIVEELERRTVSLYTSDAADERSSVDLGGRRIIKHKKGPLSIATW